MITTQHIWTQIKNLCLVYMTRPSPLPHNYPPTYPTEISNIRVLHWVLDWGGTILIENNRILFWRTKGYCSGEQYAVFYCSFGKISVRSKRSLKWPEIDFLQVFLKKVHYVFLVSSLKVSFRVVSL